MADGLGNHLHLLRAILRECTYLPDPAARTYMHNYTIQQFRKYRPKASGISYRHNAQPLSTEKKISLFNRARRRLSLLRRANQGYIKCLEKVLSNTYGRTGERRHQLMQKLLVPDIPQTHKDVEQIVPIEKYSRDWRPSSMFQALAQGHIAVRGRFDRSMRGQQNIQTQASAVPALNSWGRSMPRCRVRNLTRKWYMKTADSIFPPLSQAECKQLQQLILRPPSKNQLPRRRRRVGDLGETSGSALSASVLLKGPQKSQTFSSWTRGRPHQITPRMLQSIWAKILTHTPQMTWDTHTNTWRVEWSQLDRKRRSLPIATDEQNTLLFGTMDEQRQPI